MKRKLLLWLVEALNNWCYYLHWVPFYNHWLTRLSYEIDRKYNLGFWEEETLIQY
jgi:hypothetical protein